MSFDRGSRSRLTEVDLARFPGESLFDRVGRAVCRARCLPRKELYESWEVARRARRRFRGGRVVDLAAGHGLTTLLMPLLDPTTSLAVAVDRRRPDSAERLLDSMAEDWPVLRRTVEWREAALETVALEPTDLVVSVHACGALTDVVLDRAAHARARVVVLPCCQDASQGDLGGLGGWMDAALAIDATRVARLRAAGYRVHTQTISAQITPKNRLLLGAPA